jgi:hypothetical protein
MRFLAVTSALASLVVACSSSSTPTGSSSDRVAIDTTSACNKMINECKQAITQADCELSFEFLRVTPECANLFNTASCQDLTANGSSFEDTCFPKCTTPGSQTCNGDGTITICSDQSRTLIGDCAATCQKVLNKSYSGTCGTSYAGQTSDKDKCWCQ